MFEGQLTVIHTEDALPAGILSNFEDGHRRRINDTSWWEQKAKKLLASRCNRVYDRATLFNCTIDFALERAFDVRRVSR